MALVLNDRVKETSTTTGQGTLSLGGAATGFETFVTGIGNSNTTYYLAAHESDGTWELGIGTVTDASPDTLARTTVIDTSAGNTTKIDFASGSKTIFCTLPAGKAVFLDADGDVTLGANLSVGGNLDVTGTFDLSDSNFTNAGNIQLDSISGDSDTNTSITFSGSDVITMATGGTSALTIDASQNVTVAGDLTVSGDDITMGTNTAGNILVADGTNFNSIAAGSLSEISSVANDDVFLAVDTSGGGLKKITRSAIVSGLATSSAISNVSEDSTPQLGGDLDLNSNDIVTTSNADLELAPNGTGHVTVKGNTNSGAIQFNCEQNSHGQIVIGAAHSAGANNTLTLPSTGGNADLVSTASTATLTNKTLTSPKINEDVAVTSTATELNVLDGITAVVGELNALDLGSTAVGTAIASKAVILDSNKDYTGIRNLTITGELDGATLDLSGDADIAGTTNLDNTDIDGTLTVDGTAIDFNATSTLAIDNTNTSNGITIGTSTSGVPISIGHSTSEVTVNDNLTVTGNFTVSGTSTTVDSTTVAVADSMFKLAKDQGTSADALDFGFYGQYGVGGTAKFAGVFRDVSATGDPFTFFDDLQAEPGTTVNTSGTGYDLADIAAGGATFADNVTITGDADVDGTLEADAITVNGTALNTVIAGVTVTNATTAAVATTVTISDNESTNEDNAIIFTAGGDVDGGNIGLESDGDLTYNPSTGRLTATQLAGTLQTAAQANITSLGTLTTLTVDNVIINGSTIGHTGDTDLMTVASGVLTVAGEVDATSLDISGDADIDGTLEADAITVDGTAIGSLFASQGDATALAIALG
jgi:cytoskeletal protein CcmA (bactofilin family)